MPPGVRPYPRARKPKPIPPAAPPTPQAREQQLARRRGTPRVIQARAPTAPLPPEQRPIRRFAPPIGQKAEGGGQAAEDFYAPGGEAAQYQGTGADVGADYYVRDGKLFVRSDSWPLTRGITRAEYDALVSTYEPPKRGREMFGGPRLRGGGLAAGLPPEQQGQEFGLPPGGPGTLRGRFAAFMGSPLGKVTQAAPGALTGGILGSAFGPVGTVVGAAIGGVGTLAMGEYGQQEVGRLAAAYGWAEAQRRFDEENVVGQALYWLDFARATLEQTLGTAGQIGGALTEPEKFGTPEEVVGNLGAAWKAARLTYEALPVWPGQFGGQSTFVDYDLPQANGGLTALVAARRRIAAGEDPAAVYYETAAQYGAPGQIRELISGFAADPLNFTNIVETRGLGVLGWVLGDAELVRAAQVTRGRPGLFATREAYRNQLLMKPMREGFQAGREFTALQRWTIGKELLNLAETGKYTPPKWWELGRLTPQSMASEHVFRAHDTLGTLISRLPDDETLPDSLARMLTGFKNADPDNLPMDFPEAARLGAAIEGRIVKRSINSEAVLDRVRAYQMTAPEQQLLADLAAVTGTDVKSVLDRLQGGEAEALLRELRAASTSSAGPEGAALLAKLDDGSLNAEVLTQMHKTFREDLIPYTPEMLKAAVMEGLIEGAGEWAARTFGVKGQDFVTRLAQAVKGVESVALLGLNISYPIRNLWNGELTTIVDGVWGLRGIESIRHAFGKMEVPSIEAEWERLGIQPARAMTGMGLADIGEEFGAATLTQKAVAKGLAPIQKAAETTGILAEIRRVTSQIADKLPPTHVAQNLEKWQGARAFFEGFRQMWSQSWRKDVSIPRLPQTLESALRAVDPRLPDYLMAAAQAGYNPAEITAAVLAQAPAPRVHQFYGEAARAVGIGEADVARLMALDGVGDRLNAELAKLGAGAKPSDVRRIFGDVRKAAAKSIAEQVRAETAVITERAANVPGVEGALGVLNITDEIETDLFNTFTRHAQNLDRRWAEVYREGKPKGAVMRALFAEADEVWTNYQAREVAAYQGLADGMGGEGLRAKGQGLGLSPEFMPAVRARQADIRAFNETRTRLLRQFFDTEHPPGTRTAAWNETTRAIDAAYFDLAQALDSRAAKMDDYLVAAYRGRVSTNVAERVEAWRAAVRKFNAEDMGRVRQFRQEVRTLPDYQQAKAWTAFHDERLRRRWEAMQATLNLRRTIGQPPAQAAAVGAAQPIPEAAAAIAPEAAALRQAQGAAPPVEATPRAAVAPEVARVVETVTAALDKAEKAAALQPDLIGEPGVTLTRAGFRAQLVDSFPEVTASQIDTTLALTDARARTWARDTGRPWQEWYETHLRGVRKGAPEGDVPAERLYQVAEIKRLSRAEADLYLLWREQGVREGQMEARLAGLRGERLPEGLAARERTLATKYRTALAEAQRLHPEALNLYQADALAFRHKGAVEFLADGRAIIRALEGPDVSTLVHEVGHVFRRDLPEADLRVAESHYGVKDGVWEVGHEESFAGDFERYLATAQAPTPALVRVFERLRDWLREIYASVANFIHPVEDEMAGVFDRLLGGEGEKGQGPRAKGQGALSAREQIVRPRAELPPEISQAVERQATEMLGEVTQGEPGQRVFVRDEAGYLTGEVLPEPSTYPDWYGAIAARRQTIEAALRKIIQDEGADVDRAGQTIIARLKRVILDELQKTDEFTGRPPEPEVLRWVGRPAEEIDAARVAWATAGAEPAIQPFVEMARTPGMEITLNFYQALTGGRVWAGKLGGVEAVEVLADFPNAVRVRLAGGEEYRLTRDLITHAEVPEGRAEPVPAEVARAAPLPPEEQAALNAVREAATQLLASAKKKQRQANKLYRQLFLEQRADPEGALLAEMNRLRTEAAAETQQALATAAGRIVPGVPDVDPSVRAARAGIAAADDAARVLGDDLRVAVDTLAELKAEGLYTVADYLAQSPPLTPFQKSLLADLGSAPSADEVSTWLRNYAEIAQREPGVDGAVAWERAKGQGTLFQTEALDSSIRAQAGGAEEFPLPNGKRGVLLGQAEDGAWLVREIESGLVQRVPARPGQSAFLPPGTLDDLTGGGPMPHAAAREEAWYDRMLPVLDDLQGRVERLVSQGVVRGHESLPPEVQAGVRDWLNDVSGRMSEAKLFALKWGQFKRDAALLNYSRRYQLNNFLGLVFPYEFWMTHSMLQWALRAIEKPALLANYYRVQKFLSAEVTKPGFPSRLEGRVKIPLPFLPEWMGGGMWVDPMQFGLPLNQFFQPWEQLQMATTKLESRAARKLEELVAGGQISQAEYAEALQTQSGPAWARAVQLAQADDANLKFDGVDLASLVVSPHLPLTWAWNAARGTPERIAPLPGTRQLKALTAALGIGPAGGVNVEAGVRRHFGLPLFDQWEDYRVDRELANMAAEGLISPKQAQAAMIERGGAQGVFETAQRRAAQVGGFGTLTGMIFGTTSGVFPEGEQRQRLLGELFSAAYRAQDDGDPEALGRFFEQHPEYEARLALYDKPEERVRNFLIDQVWTGYDALPALYRRQATAAFGADFTEGFLSKETRSYDAIPVEVLAAWARTLGQYVPRPVEGDPQRLDFAPPEVAQEAEQFYAQRERFDMDWVRALQSAYFQIPEHARATDTPYPPAVEEFYTAKDRLFPTIGDLQEMYFNLPEVAQTAARDQLYPGIFAVQDAYFALPERGKARKAFREQHPELVSYWEWNRTYKAEHPEEQLRKGFRAQFPELERYWDWRDTWKAQHPREAAYLDESDVSARTAFVQQHPELAAYWDWRRGWLAAHPVSAPWITEGGGQKAEGRGQEAEGSAQAAEGGRQKAEVLGSPEMQLLVTAYLFADEPLPSAARLILQQEFEQQGQRPGRTAPSTGSGGRGNFDQWLLEIMAYGGNLGGESYTYGTSTGSVGTPWTYPGTPPRGQTAEGGGQKAEGGRQTAAVPGQNVAPSGNNIAPNPYATTPQGGVEGVMAWAQMAAQYGGEAGVPPEFILALIKAESNGNPRAVGDAGHSVGLFQLHDRGVGYGYTVEQRYDPALQFQLMMPRIAAAYQAGVAKGLSGRQLAMFVGQQAERPAAAAVPRYGVAYDQIMGAR